MTDEQIQTDFDNKIDEKIGKKKKSSKVKESLQGFKLEVLDKGFVVFLDMLNDEHFIPESARLSYRGEGKIRTNEEDSALVDHLIKNNHTSPLEQINFSFKIKLPIFIMRQLVRHRTARLNEMSGRYSVLDDDFYIPDIDQIQAQDKKDKQGKEEDGSISDENKHFIRNKMIEETEMAYKNYKERLEMGVSREIARINLPLSIYTQIHWNIDLNNLFHLLKLRLDKHAQWEIRAYASAIYAFVKRLAPNACTSFENHILKSVTFSKEELHLINKTVSIYDYKYIEEYAKEKYGYDKKKIDIFINKIKEAFLY